MKDITIGTDVNTIDSKWLKKNILMQSLANGTCALPVISNKCPHANACLTCTNFRTDKCYLDSHKKQFEHTVKIIEIAKSNGWKRQEEKNLSSKAALIKMLKERIKMLVAENKELKKQMEIIYGKLTRNEEL